MLAEPTGEAEAGSPEPMSLPYGARRLMGSKVTSSGNGLEAQREGRKAERQARKLSSANVTERKCMIDCRDKDEHVAMTEHSQRET